MSLETLKPLSQDALQSLGISGDLFETSNMSPVFFNGWQNQTQLIEHLVLFSNVLMVMSAKRGSGKSTFISLLIETLPDEIEKVVLPSDALAMENNELIRLIGKALHCSVNGHAMKEKLESLHQRSQELKRHLLFIIDDADQLTEDNLATISALINLSSDNEGYLHFFLLGFQRLKAKVRDMSTREASCQSHVLELAPLKVDDIKLYLNHCYSHVKGEISELSLKDDELEGVRARSDDNIAYIQTNCRALLNRKFSEKFEPEAPGFKLNRKWLGAIGGLLLVLIMVNHFSGKERPLIYQKKSISTNIFSSQEAKPINFDSVKEEFERSHQKHLEKRAELTGTGQSLQDESIHEQLHPFPQKNRSYFTPTAMTSKTHETIAVPTPSKEEEQAAIEATRSSLIAEPPTALIDKVVVLPSPSLSKPRLVAKVQKVPAQKEEASTNTVKKAPVAQPKFAKSLPKARKPGGYAVQLVGASTLDSVKTYVYQRNLQKQVVFFKTQNKGKSWYVAVLGPFKSKTDAYAKLKSLPSNVRKNKPWVRSVAGLGHPTTLKA